MITRRRMLEAMGACVLSPAMTEGPFFVDGELERSDITARAPYDTHGTRFTRNARDGIFRGGRNAALLVDLAPQPAGYLGKATLGLEI